MLAYLHSGCQQKIIHCDVKPENILLHDNSYAKISDFGSSRHVSLEQSNLFTTMRGTCGYLAPEWFTSSAIPDKADVYSFGMVLLEIVSGRKTCSLLFESHNVDNKKRRQWPLTVFIRMQICLFIKFWPRDARKRMVLGTCRPEARRAGV